MKKVISVLSAFLTLAGMLTGCSGKAERPAEEKKTRIVTTIFPEYDWVREILGDKAESADVAMLLDNSVDLHSYQPTADDIIKISDCDLLSTLAASPTAGLKMS